jgi:hypothetical protein
MTSRGGLQVCKGAKPKAKSKNNSIRSLNNGEKAALIGKTSLSQGHKDQENTQAMLQESTSVQKPYLARSIIRT